ncbi:DUF4159 domain-containing protein [bacterium]|nr:DUF4159 domain-containing protein [bacterium]
MRPIIAYTAFILLAVTGSLAAQSGEKPGIPAIARIRYQGGGDWYNDRSALPNLCRYINTHTLVTISERESVISLTDETLFSYPVIFMTGHGRISLTDTEADRLREYLLQGGFLYADDDYGMDTSFRETMKQVFPERDLELIPFSHGIYHAHFSFPDGLPKIHEHDSNPPAGYGIRDSRGRLMVFYTWETNLSDGWTDAQVHNDPPPKREEALRMGTNIIIWALRQ